MKKARLTEQARQLKLEKDKARIAHYRKLTSVILKDKHDKVYNQRALANTTTLLSINPEFNAVWNYRRDIFIYLISNDPTKKAGLLGEDLDMIKAMMKQYPKCYWIWNHRRWCLEELSQDHLANWAYELELVLKVLEMDSRNFHGWHYRRYVVGSIEREQQEKLVDKNKLKIADLKLYLKEYKYATSKIEKNISNFSAWHNRSKLIPKIFEMLHNFEDFPNLDEYSLTAILFQSPVALLRFELDLVKTGMFMDAADTSVWLFMQWLLTEDLFVSELKKTSHETYLKILQQQLENVQELNTLEKEDSPNNLDNVGCVKMIIFIRALINKQKDRDYIVDDQIVKYLSTLVELDPLRKSHYLDQLNKVSPIIS